MISILSHRILARSSALAGRLVRGPPQNLKPPGNAVVFASKSARRPALRLKSTNTHGKGDVETLCFKDLEAMKQLRSDIKNDVARMDTSIDAKLASVKGDLVSNIYSVKGDLVNKMYSVESSIGWIKVDLSKMQNSMELWLSSLLVVNAAFFYFLIECTRLELSSAIRKQSAQIEALDAKLERKQ